MKIRPIGQLAATLVKASAVIAWALLKFNVGLETGQLMIVGVATAVLFSVRDWKRYRQIVSGSNETGVWRTAQ